MKYINVAILLFLSCVCFGQDIPDDILGSPVLIEHSKGDGTGFFLVDSNDIYVVTAKHVLFDINTNKLLTNEAKLTAYYNDPSIDEKNIFNIDLKLAEKFNLIRHENKKDVVIVHIGKIDYVEDKLITKYWAKIVDKDKGAWISYIPINRIKTYDEVKVGTEIFLFGYPTTIGLEKIPQYDFSRPLVRRGIVAGKYNKLKTLILDCPSYFGNSGGPVIQKSVIRLTTSYHLIGIMIQFIPYEEKWINTKTKLIKTDRFNSDYSVAISADNILNIINNYKKSIFYK